VDDAEMPGAPCDQGAVTELPVTGEVAAAVVDLVPLLRRFCRGPYGLALGGAHAKGVDDAQSDLDLYAFCDDIHPNAVRSEWACAHSARITAVVSWGDDTDPVNAGTDFEFDGLKTECWFRGVSAISRAVEECAAGTVRQDLVTWTVAGFYNHCCLSDLKAMVPLVDPHGLIAAWKEQVAVYPPNLRRAIVERHLGAARFWPGSFHYASAVERGDTIYTTGIVQQVLHNLIQVFFALNRIYFPGDKKLAAALGKLRHTPEGLVRTVTELMATPEASDIEALRAQRRGLQALLAATESLVGTHMPDDGPSPPG